MQRVEYNAPDTRARVEALRRRRKAKGRSESQGESQSSGDTAPLRDNRPAFRLNEAVRDPTLKTRGGRHVRRPLEHARTRTRATTASHPRARRERQKPQVQPGVRRRLAHWLSTGQLVSLLLLLASLGGLAYLFTTPGFTIQHIAVEGNEFVSRDFLTTASGLQATSVWFVNEQAIIQHLQENPYIERASLHVALPNRATIRIVERQPDVRWQVGFQHYLVDSDGRVLDVAQDLPDASTLVIVDTSNRLLQPNDQLDPDAIKLARSLSVRLPAELSLTPATIGWDMGLGVYVLTPQGQTIVFGQYTGLDYKMAVLRSLLDDDTAFSYLDLRASNPFYRVDPTPDEPAPAPADDAEQGSTGRPGYAGYWGMI